MNNESGFAEVTLGKENTGKRIYECLVEKGVYINAPCGGEGKCGKCKVRVLSGLTSGTPDINGEVLACQAVVLSELELLVPLPAALDDKASAKAVKTDGLTPDAEYSAALDVGTTTVALALIDCGSGDITAVRTFENPQKAFGADVISRISACERDVNNLYLMQNALLDALKDNIKDLGVSVGTLAVTGNTTMLHIFCGVSPVSLGKAPFTPVFTRMRELCGSELGLPVNKVTVLPSVSAYIGADVVCGVYSTGMTGLDYPTLLTDIGTNGESVLCTGTLQGNRLYAVSAAAGPALEGAEISCGMAGVAGAISSFDESGFRTVLDAPPTGVCGAGLIDITAYLLESALLDENGALESGSFKVAEGIILTEEDVRKIQLAKSAIRASLEALLSSCGIGFEDIERLFLAGGMGYYMNVRSAGRIGLLPRHSNPTVTAVGNSALAGAAKALACGGFEELNRIAENCRTVELANSPVFAEEFIKNIRFPEQ